jgi:hypothetical protein
MPFIQEHYPAIFGHKDLAGRFLPTPMTDAKRRFFAEMDYFVFRVGPDAAGVLMGHPTDWTTYYIRSAALLPEHRDRRLLSHFVERLDAPLRAAGVERIETECSPANVPVIRLVTSQGWIATGSTSSERWGLMLRYTKYLSDDARVAFVRQYTAMPISQRRERAATRDSSTITQTTGDHHEEVRDHHGLTAHGLTTSRRCDRVTDHTVACTPAPTDIQPRSES